jgi:hypothetical protein
VIEVVVREALRAALAVAGASEPGDGERALRSFFDAFEAYAALRANASAKG